MGEYSTIHSRQSQENIVKARRAAADQDYKKAHKHLFHAEQAFNRHVNHLQNVTKAPRGYINGEVSSFKAHHGSVMADIPQEHGGTKPMKKSDHATCEKCKKKGMEKGCGCGYMNKKKLKKNDKVFVGSPRADKRYDYIHYNKLHPEDRVAAERKFGLKDIGQYKYPVDKMGGRLVHATRMKHDEAVVPQATSSIKPEHKRNMPVRIHSGEHAGKFGVVAAPSPYHPNKLAVQIGPDSWDKVHVDHSHVEPSQGKIKKAVTALFDIYERLSKKDWEYGKKKDKNYRPSKVGELHPEKNYIGVQHPHQGLTWQYDKQAAANIDRTINNPELVEQAIANAPKSHQGFLGAVIKHLQNCPDRHLVSTTTPGGGHKMRARHLKKLMLSPTDVHVEYHPRGISMTFNRHSSYRGEHQDPTMFQFVTPSAKKKQKVA